MALRLRCGYGGWEGTRALASNPASVTWCIYDLGIIFSPWPWLLHPEMRLGGKSTLQGLDEAHTELRLSEARLTVSAS